METIEQSGNSHRSGEGYTFAWQVLSRFASAMGAERMLPITSAHINGCFAQGPASLDFVDKLHPSSTRVAVPTTLNTGGTDMAAQIRPANTHDDRVAGNLMRKYLAMGCKPTFTCTPYQLPAPPQFGQHLAWAESNAIVYANSVIGARTARYGDFVDISAAIIGLVPAFGLHLDTNRLATVQFGLSDDVRSAGTEHELHAALLGWCASARSNNRIPVILGLESATPSSDWLKSFSAAFASTSTAGMFHIVGVTPEASVLAQATGGKPYRTQTLTMNDLRNARTALGRLPDRSQRIDGVSVGTPHLSAAQLRRAAEQLRGRSVVVPTYASTNRNAAEQASDAVRALRECGVTVVLDTCTYVSRRYDLHGAYLTDSVKWAFYAPANIGVTAALATLEECLECAVAGRVTAETIKAGTGAF